MNWFEDEEQKEEQTEDKSTEESSEDSSESGEDGDSKESNDKDKVSQLMQDGGSAIESIFNSGLIYYERLPMLEVVYDRLIRMMSTSLRNFTSDNVEVSLDTITSTRFGDYIDQIPMPALVGVFKAEEWGNSGLITIESSLIYAIIDVLLGGRRGTAAMRVEGRPYTTIERSLVERLITVILNDMCQAFNPISTVVFNFERLESNPSFATIARPTNASVLTKLKVDMDERGGMIEILLPYATLEPVRDDLLQSFMGEKFGNDSVWETHLAKEVWITDMQMRAILDRLSFSLKEVLSWEVGSKIDLHAKPDSSIELVCGEKKLFAGQMGQKDGNIAVQITDNFIKQQEKEDAQPNN